MFGWSVAVSDNLYSWHRYQRAKGHHVKYVGQYRLRYARPLNQQLARFYQTIFFIKYVNHLGS